MHTWMDLIHSKINSVGISILMPRINNLYLYHIRQYHNGEPSHPTVHIYITQQLHRPNCPGQQEIARGKKMFGLRLSEGQLENERFSKYFTYFCARYKTGVTMHRGWQDEFCGHAAHKTVRYVQFRKCLTHCGLVTPYGGRDLCQHWFR